MSCFSDNMTFDPKLCECIGICENALVLDPEPCASHMLDRQAFCKRTGASGLQNHIFCCRKKNSYISLFSKKLTAILFWMLYSKKAQSYCRCLCPICPLSLLLRSQKKNPISDYWPTTSLRERGWFKKVSQKYRQAEKYCYKQPVHIPSINRIMNKAQKDPAVGHQNSGNGVEAPVKAAFIRSTLTSRQRWLEGYCLVIWWVGWFRDHVSHCCAS